MTPPPRDPASGLTLITGAPCSGKTTYATALAATTERPMVDVDLLARALYPGGAQGMMPQPITELARYARRGILARGLKVRAPLIVVDTLMTNPLPNLTRWLRNGAEIIWLATPRVTCDERAADRADPGMTRGLISTWFSYTEPLLANYRQSLRVITGGVGGTESGA